VENVTFLGLKPVKAEIPLSSHDFKQQTSSQDYKNQAKCHDLKNQASLNSQPKHHETLNSSHAE
jgi:hypothetical protein